MVAEEVRSLALRSAQAAKDTSALIEESQQRAGQGVTASGEAQDLLKKIREGVEGATTVVQQVTAASREQAKGVQQITQAVSQMDQVTQSNAANAEENAAASEELSAQAQSLTSIVKDLLALVAGRNGNGHGNGNGNGHRSEEDLASAAGNSHRSHGTHAALPHPRSGISRVREHILRSQQDAEETLRPAELSDAKPMEFRDLPS